MAMKPLSRVELHLNDGIMECLDNLVKVYEEKYSGLRHGNKMTYQEVIEILIIGEAKEEKVVSF
jgi:hypothetical protein